MSSPTKRTLTLLRRLGYTAEVVEKTLPRCFIKRDLFGCIDILAVRPGGILAVQATSGSNAAARVKKAIAEPKLRAVLLSGIVFEVWSWRASKKGLKKWELTRRPITIADLEVPSGQAS